MQRTSLALAVFVSLMAGPVGAQAPQGVPDARASDPIALGWMVGAPPPADRIISFADSSFVKFPQLRWSFSHWRELFATVEVPRGTGPSSVLLRAERTDLDGVTFTPLGASEPMTWAQSLAANYTDGILVFHKGRIVYEKYFGALKPEGQHIAHSVTKSLVGTIASMLVAEGQLDAGALVVKYIPELAGRAFLDATVRQVLDMTTALKFDETYADPNADVWKWTLAASLLPRPPGYDGPGTSYDYLKMIAKQGGHGQAFSYKSPNTEVVGWLLRRVTGKPLEQILSERLWQPLGMERDGYLQIDTSRTPLAAGGLNLTLRDLGRFCEMMRADGRFNGQQVVPASVIADIRRGASKDDFAKAGYKSLPGWSYRNTWWISHERK